MCASQRAGRCRFKGHKIAWDGHCKMAQTTHCPDCHTSTDRYALALPCWVALSVAWQRRFAIALNLGP